MTGAQLAAWERRAAARAGRRGPWRSLVVGLVLGGGLAALARAGAVDDAHLAASAIVVITSVGVLLGAPRRGFWTSDAALLGTLPIPGEALRARAERGAIAAGVRAVLLGVPAMFGAWHAEPVAALGGAVVAVGAAVVALLLAPPAIGGGAALATSAGLQQEVGKATGAGGPRVVFLAFVPAFLSAALALWILGLLPSASGAPLLGPARVSERRWMLLAGPVAAFLLAMATRPAVARALERATGKMAALDDERLAHVELERARGLERAAGAGLSARRLYEKDVACARRRWPIVYLAQGACVIAAWLTALIAGPSGALRGGVLVGAAIVALAALLGRLITSPPVEIPRLLATLPLAPSSVRAAKLRLVVWRTLIPLALAAGPLYWRIATGSR